MGPPSYDHYRQHYSIVLHQQTGWTHSHILLHLVVDLSLWLQTQDIHVAVRARHIPGCLNVIADCLSRPNEPITTEWNLHPEIVNQIFGTWDTQTVDMFASVHNMHLPQFMSPFLEARALAIHVDALSQLAGEVDVHISTVPMLSKVIQKLRTNQEGEVILILIAPWWPSQPWFPPSHQSVPPGTVQPSACIEALMQHNRAAGFSK